jgi:hypothetical protein
MIPLRRLALLATVALASQTQAQAAPKTGAEVLERMRAAYAGKWYHTLTFVQKTTIRQQSGRDTVITWYESLRHAPNFGTRLRIDFAEPAGARGVIYTPDSSYGIRDGKLAGSQPNGNEFLPMIEGVYVQPVEQTLKELSGTNIDMSKVTSGKFDGRDAWIVGVSSPSDSTAPQFWIDKERNVVVRMLLKLNPNAPPYDIHLGGYVPLKGGWLATKIEMFVNGTRQQAEEYSDWKADIPLDPALFDPAQWTTAKHWAAKPAK